MVAEGRFRQDLYYRISSFPIVLPALRDRPEDIPLLVNSFISRGAVGGRELTVEPAAMTELCARDWPGNIRELRNVLDRAKLFADDGVIRAQHVARGPAQAAHVQQDSWRKPVGKALVTDADLMQAASHFHGTRRALADHLRLSERTLYRRLQALDVL